MKQPTAPAMVSVAEEPDVGAPSGDRWLRAGSLVAFAAPAGLLTYLALRGAGYDIVVRQQVALVAWLMIAAGFAAGLLTRNRLDRALLVPLLAAGALLGWMTLSLVWTESSEHTTAEIARLLGYLGLITVAVTGLDRRTARSAAAGVTAAAVTVTALALASRLFPDLVPGADDLSESFRVDRLSYPLDYWNAVGAWGAMTIALCLAWSAQARLPLTRALSLAAVPMAGACIYLTYSRGAVLGVGVAVAAVLLFGRHRWTAFAHAFAAAAGTAIAILVIESRPEIADATGGGGGVLVGATLVLVGLGCAAAAFATDRLETDKFRMRPRVTRYAVLGMAVVVLLAGLAAHNQISQAWDEFNSRDRVSSESGRLFSTGGNRSNLWASALAAFDAHPLNGTGPGTFEFWWNRDARDPENVRNAHSLYLESLAEMGLPGFVFVVALVGGLLAVAVRVLRRIEDPGAAAGVVGMCSAYCVFLVTAGIDWMWQEPAVSVLALGGIGIAIAAGTQPEARLARRAGSGRIGLRAAVAAAALIIALFQVPGIVSNQRLDASRDVAGEGDLPRSRELAQQAVDAQPWAATPYEQLALVEEAQGDLAGARADIERAIDREKTNWRYPYLLARIQVEQGRYEAAKRTFRRAAALRPLSPSFSPHTGLGLAILEGLARERRRAE